LTLFLDFFLDLENQAQIQKFEDQLIDAQTNAGETEIREALLAKAEYLAKIGDKVNFISNNQQFN